MKSFTIYLILLLGTLNVFAQPPQAINYQAVVRRSTGDLLSNQDIHFRISILQDSAGGTVVYKETHNAETNLYGLANLAIGTGTVLMGNFDEISWGSTGHYIRIEMDTTDGSNFYEMGTIQLLSVPYALYAKDVSTVSPEDTARWNTAYGWGDHALVGYLTGYSETDPVFGLSPASGILGSQILNWDTAYSWGDHSIAGYLKSENDPKVGSLGLNYLPKWNGSALVNSSIFETVSGNIGMGTAVPQEKLHVSGNMVADTAYATAFSGNSPLLLQTNGTTRIYVSDPIGNTGIATLTPSEKLEVQGMIRASEGFNINGLEGLSDTLNQMTAFDFDKDSLKYRTYIYNGGIITYISNESNWRKTVGNYLYPMNAPCPGLDSIIFEGKTYHTVQIGSQCWLKENLDVGTMIISDQGGQLQTNNGIIEKYCYNNDTTQCNGAGGLYEWHEAMQYDTAELVQGICPDGWHIPSDNEWKVLCGIVDSKYPIGDPQWNNVGNSGLDAGGNLKESDTAHWFPPNTGATNRSGFTGLPGSFRINSNGQFFNNRAIGWFWTSSQSSNDSAWSRYLWKGDATVVRGADGKSNGFFIRCMKGLCTPQPSKAFAGPDQIYLTDTITTLAGNSPAFGTGTWHIISGAGGIIDDTLSPNSSFTGLRGIVYLLTWSISNICGTYIDTMAISFAPIMGQPCPDILTISYGGQTYNTVLIGIQCWLKENLNVGTMIISDQEGHLQTDNGIVEKYCPDNDSAKCNLYGGLYEWDEAMQYNSGNMQGICPDGWHIPDNFEWVALEYYLGKQMAAGGKMKSTGSLEEYSGLWHAPNTGATNSSGFTGLPAGIRWYEGGFLHLNYAAEFWSTSWEYTAGGWWYMLIYSSTLLGSGQGLHMNGLSIRCLKNN